MADGPGFDGDDPNRVYETPAALWAAEVLRHAPSKGRGLLCASADIRYNSSRPSQLTFADNDAGQGLAGVGMEHGAFDARRQVA